MGYLFRIDLLGLFILLAVLLNVSGNCPCRDANLCKPIQKIPEREVFAFVLHCTNDTWTKFDWKKLTTIVLCGFFDPELLCYAHQHGVRVIKIANFPKSNLTNKLARQQWIKSNVKDVMVNFMDGINIDFEDAIGKDELERDGLTALLNETKIAFHSTIPGSQVTFDVAWSPDGIDQRWYDYFKLSQVADILFVMSYDEQSQIWSTECTARANAGLLKTRAGIMNYIKLGIPPEKLILGVPWYGYNYPCLNVSKTNICYIKHVPFRGANCSDAAGKEFSYNDIVGHFFNYTTTGMLWDEDSLSPYFNFKDPETGSIHQMWFDNPASLLYKYLLAVGLDLHGVGMWTANFLDYSDTPKGKKQRMEMWSIMPN